MCLTYVTTCCNVSQSSEAVPVTAVVDITQAEATTDYSYRQGVHTGVIRFHTWRPTTKCHLRSILGARREEEYSNEIKSCCNCVHIISGPTRTQNVGKLFVLALLFSFNIESKFTSRAIFLISISSSTKKVHLMSVVIMSIDHVTCVLDLSLGICFEPLI